MKPLLILTALLASAAAPAAPPVDATPAAGVVVRLSAAQIEALEIARLERSAQLATETIIPAEHEDDRAKGRRVHGEIGFGIGTSGYSEQFGTIVAPLGEEGFVAFSFQRQRQNDRRFHRH